MHSSNGLDAILRQIRASGDKQIVLPPCPSCRRRLRTTVSYYTRGGKTLASIALWCTCCTVATSAFNVDPIPPWASPKQGAADATTGG